MSIEEARYLLSFYKRLFPEEDISYLDELIDEDFVIEVSGFLFAEWGLDEMHNIFTLEANMLENVIIPDRILLPRQKESGKHLEFIRSLSIQKDQNVFLTKDPETNRKWVIKWPAKKEMENYKRIRDLGGRIPDILPGFRLFTIPLVVLEFLQPLDVNDNPFDLYFQLVTTQLKYIHKFAMHQDLKPDNIRKRIKNGQSEFLIIDMDLATLQPTNGRGYRRILATPIYAERQLNYPRDSYKTDLYELALVVHELFLHRMYLMKKGYYFDKTDERHEYNIRSYVDYYGIFTAEHLANIEIMRELKDIPDAEKLNYHLAMERLLRDDDTALLFQSGLNYALKMLKEEVTKLPEFDIPADAHNEIGEFVRQKRFQNVYNEFLKNEEKYLLLKCHICQERAINRCGNCWNAKYLCGEMKCLLKHKCS